MSVQAVVRIVGAQVACKDGTKDSWREVAAWAARQLIDRFGPVVQVEYFDLFDPGCPAVPEGFMLPLVLLNDRVVSSGGKISIPLIRKSLEEFGITPLLSRIEIEYEPERE